MEGRGLQEDEEQTNKFYEIVELLKSAGYYRVRIQDLSNFDKIVGGMAWCIANSGVDADVNVLFTENSTIGQKIKISDQIVKALAKMKCSVPVQSQHIQGSNWIELFTVVKWLVRKVLETREEYGDQSRKFSESQFSKNHRLATDLAFEEKKPVSTGLVSHVEQRYRPARLFRPVRSALSRPEDERTQAVLVEYGIKIRSARLAGAGKKVDENKLAEEEQRLQEMMKNMRKDGGKLRVGDLMADGDYSRGEQALTPAELAARQSSAKEDAYLKQTAGLERRNDALKRQKEELEGKVETAASMNTQAKEKLDQRIQYNERVRQEIAKLKAMETPENTHLVKKIRELLALVDVLEVQKNVFMQSCQKQKEELENAITELAKAEAQTAQGERERQLMETYTQSKNKMLQLEGALAKRSRDIRALELKKDELPSRTELNQYQRRFVELYDQMSAKLVETRRYYNTYNTLSNTKDYHTREVSYLESIHTSYPQYMRGTKKASKPRLQFLEHTKSMVDSLQVNIDKVKDKYKDQKTQRDDINTRYLQQVEIQREYYKLCKEFQEECAKNELLTSQLAETA